MNVDQGLSRTKTPIKQYKHSPHDSYTELQVFWNNVIAFIVKKKHDSHGHHSLIVYRKCARNNFTFQRVKIKLKVS